MSKSKVLKKKKNYEDEYTCTNQCTCVPTKSSGCPFAVGICLLVLADMFYTEQANL